MSKKKKKNVHGKSKRQNVSRILDLLNNFLKVLELIVRLVIIYKS
jgi:hypothetical protein